MLKKYKSILGSLPSRLGFFNRPSQQPSNPFAEERMMNINTKRSWTLGVFLFLLMGALITPAYGESPVIITPFQWYTGVTDFGTSKSASFSVQNGGSVPLVIRNIRVRTTSSCFSVTPSRPLPATLAASEEMHVEITFTAEAEGLQRASLEVDYGEITQ
jgi:hypothetical protein